MDRGAVQFELRETGATLDPSSDTALVSSGYGTLTKLFGVTATNEQRQAEQPRGEVHLTSQPTPERTVVGRAEDEGGSA